MKECPYSSIHLQIPPCFGGARIHLGSPLDEWKGWRLAVWSTNGKILSLFLAEWKFIYCLLFCLKWYHWSWIYGKTLSRRIRPALVSWRKGKTSRLFCFRLFPSWHVITLCLPTTAPPSSHGAYLGFSLFWVFFLQLVTFHLVAMLDIHAWQILLGMHLFKPGCHNP